MEYIGIFERLVFDKNIVFGLCPVPHCRGGCRVAMVMWTGQETFNGYRTAPIHMALGIPPRHGYTVNQCIVTAASASSPHEVSHKNCRGFIQLPNFLCAFHCHWQFLYARYRTQGRVQPVRITTTLLHYARHSPRVCRESQAMRHGIKTKVHNIQFFCGKRANLRHHGAHALKI